MISYAHRAMLLLLIGTTILLDPAESRGSNDAQRAEELARQLRATDHEKWDPALQELGAMGPDALPALDAILVFLAGGSHSASLSANAICYLGDTPEQAIPYLMSKLRPDGSSYFQLPDFQLPPELRLLQLHCASICRALANAGAAAVKPIRACLKSDDSDERVNAAITLGLIGQGAAATAPDLRGMLRDPDTTARAAAAWSLAEVGGVTAEAVAELVLLAGQRPELPRAFAIHALGYAGTAAEPHIDLITQYIKECADSEHLTDEAEIAIRAAGRLGSVAEQALPAMKELATLKELPMSLRIAAAEAVARIAPVTERDAMIGFLRRQLGHNEARLRAACSLAALRAEDAVPTLVEHLMIADAATRATAASRLGTLGPAAAPAKEYLRRLAQYDTVSAVRAEARSAIRRIEQAP